MANDFTGWPWIIDTPGPGILVLSTYGLSRIRWVSKTALAGDDAVITDREGNVLWESVAAGDNFVESDLFEKPPPVNGLIVPVLDSGKLYIYRKIEADLRLPPA